MENNKSFSAKDSVESFSVCEDTSNKESKCRSTTVPVTRSIFDIMKEVDEKQRQLADLKLNRPSRKRQHSESKLLANKPTQNLLSQTPKQNVRSQHEIGCISETSIMDLPDKVLLLKYKYIGLIKITLNQM